MKATLVQMDAAITDPAARETFMLSAIETAKSDGSDVVVFPELAPSGYGAGPDIEATAGDVAEALAPWQEASERSGIAIVLGLAIRSETGLANTAVCLRPGEEPIVYGKRILYGDYEKAMFVPGRRTSPIFEIAGMRCGLLVCFDVEFPEFVRDLALRGAEALLVPTALPRGDSARFIAEKLLPVRAFENQVFIVYAGHSNDDVRFGYQGLSVIAAPDGTALIRAEERGSTVLSADLRAQLFEVSRTENPYLREITAFLE